MGRMMILAGRVVAIATVLGVGALAFGAFVPDAPLWENLLNFVLYLLPGIGLLVFLILAWFWPLVGGMLFLMASLAPELAFSQPLSTNLLLSVPPALAGALLIIGAVLSTRHT